MKTEATHREQVEHLAELIDGIDICMLTTIDDDGKPWSRPMGTQHVTFDGALWFFTRDDSEKVTHIRHRPGVGIAFSKPSDQEYVTMAGRAAVVDDRQKAEELWSEPLATWFPDGLDDPHLRLIKVEIERAEYWDSPSSFIVYAFGYAKAKLTGEPPRDLGKHAKVSL